MDLNIFWFLLIAVLWTGYLVLEGFDFGVGMLLPVMGNTRKFGVERAEKRRRVLINSIGPVWDGNEVWLLTAGGATFAAFPEWYASLFSGFYLALFIILVGLIVRVCAFEWRAKIDSPAWRAGCDAGIVFGSFIPALLWGVAFANIVRGVPLNADHQYTGTFFGLLNPYALLGGLALMSIFLLHGAIFIALKSRGEVFEDAGDLAARLSVPALAIGGVWAIWTQLAYGKGWTWVPVLVAALALAGAVAATRARKEKGAFALTTLTIVMVVMLIFGSMYPNVLPSTVDPATNSLDIYNASSTPYTLTVMSWVAVILTPIVLIYQGYSYWVFRARLSTKQMGPHHGLTFGKPTAKHH
ncbi:MAG: cytochrome d ubiquinol oxidase subunit II [Actinomycetales bacterium]